MSNLELGFGYATVHFLAQARARGDDVAEREVLATSFLVFLVAGLAGGTALVACAAPLAQGLLHITPGLQASAESAFRIGGLIFFLSFLSSCFSGGLQALGRLDLLNRSRAVFGTASPIASVLVVMSGRSLVEVFVAQASVSAASCVVLALLLAKARGGLVLPMLYVPMLRRMFRFGAAIFAGGVAYQAMINGPPFVLALKVSSAEIPAFSVPHSVLQRLILLVTAAALAFFPFVSGHVEGTDRTRLASIFMSHLRFTLLIMGPIAAFLALAGQPVLAAWISPIFANDAAPCLALLAFAALVVAFSAPAADVARGLGHPSWVLVYTTLVALLAIAGAWWLVPVHGAVGASAAMLGGLAIVTVPSVFVVATRLLSMSAPEVVRALVLPVLAIAGFSGALIVGIAHGAALWRAVGVASVASIAYSIAVYAWVLTSREREVLRGLIGKVGR